MTVKLSPWIFFEKRHRSHPIFTSSFEEKKDFIERVTKLLLKFYFVGSGNGKEDCLFVSIWSTKEMMVEAVKKPAMVWIHGGAWSGGDGILDRTNLLNEGVIGMTVQYRLGFLGYSMLEEAEEVHKGNWGSQDQARFFSKTLYNSQDGN